MINSFVWSLTGGMFRGNNVVARAILPQRFEKRDFDRFARIEERKPMSRRLQEILVASLGILVPWYFFAYVGTGIFPKVFTKGLFGIHKISDMANLHYSDIGSVATCLLLLFLLGWHKEPRNFPDARVGSARVPWLVYLAISGLCTAIIIPTTTLMYSFGVSVMLAMVVMRGCVIIVSRLVDALHIRAGILQKKVTLEENLAVVFAIGAVLVGLLRPPHKGEDPFSLFHSAPAMVTLGLYVAAYFVRLYIMNWYKRTPQSNNAAYTWCEQAFAAGTLALVTAAVIFSGSHDERALELANAAKLENFNGPAILGGIPFGLAAIPSVLLFMYKGRSATFTGLVNRLTSLIAGTTSTLILAALFAGHWITVKMDWPDWIDGVAFGCILAAIECLRRGEKKQRALAPARA